jgi:hypothetical protein
MFQFEISLARYMIEMQKEREAKAAAKAEKQAEQERLNQSKLGEDFLRNTGDTKSQISNSVKRSTR